MAQVAEMSRGRKETRRQFYNAMFSVLDQDRQAFIPLWRDLNTHILPSKSRFLGSQVNVPDIRNRSIINSAPTLAARTLGEGMNAGITSQARPWFKLGPDDEDLSEDDNVTIWLHKETAGMINSFSRTNFYDVMPDVYEDAGTYGTSAIFVEEHDENLLHFFHLPVGSYWLGNDAWDKPRVFFRKFMMKVRNIVKKFGEFDSNGKLLTHNLSTAVVQAYTQNRLESWCWVCHVVYPNELYDGGSLDSKHKEFASVYYEDGVGGGGISSSYLSGSSPDSDKYLREKGYDYFPVLVFRWKQRGEDSYASNCPGMICLGDCQMLQRMESLSLQATEKKVKPPMNAAPSMRNQTLSLLPGAVNYVNQGAVGDGFTPTIKVDLRTDELEEKMRVVENRINEAFYKQIFLALTMDDRLQRATAEEVREIKLEKFTVLGSVLERVNIGVLNPLIDIMFARRLAKGLVDEPPRELQGKKLKVEYISILAQAQKLAASSNVRQFMSDCMVLVQSFPSAGAKIRPDQFVEELASASGINPNLMNTDEEAEEIREADRKAAQAEQMAQQMAALKQGAGAARELSQTQMGGDTALSQLMGSGAEAFP